MYVLLAHFEVFQFTRSVRQFDFEKIRIQKKIFLQPWPPWMRAAAAPRQVDRKLASKSPPAEIAARWRCRFPIQNLRPHLDIQFCVSFHFCIDKEVLIRL